MEKRRLAYILILQYCVICVESYSAGAPLSTCLTMFPKHKHRESRTSECPYKIHLSTDKYVASQEINITISADDLRPFTGIQIRAHRKQGDVEEILGSFIDFPVYKLKPFHCMGGFQNMVTHKNGNPVKTIRLIWRAPNIDVGDIIFVATFVQSFEVFWSNVETELKGAVSVNQPPHSEVDVSDVMIQFQDCGETLGCFLYPHYCSGDDCDVGLSYRTSNDSVTFQVFAKAEGYVSVGFSDDKWMGDDQTISCTAEGNRVTIQHGWNPKLFNFRQYVNGRLWNMQTMQKDGYIYCSFTRPKRMEVYVPFSNISRVYDLNNDYYIMVAWGYTYSGTDVMGKHEELPITTYSKVNFVSYEKHRGNALPFLTQIHGALMLAAWILFAGIATIIARFFKSSFGNTQFLGAGLWIQTHRFSAIMAGLLTAASFVLIFVKVDGLTNDAVIHGWVGIAVMSATVLQILAGQFRPDPKAKIRPVFNWGHWFLGKSLHLLSAAAIFLAFNSKIIPYSQKLFGTVIVFIWIGLQIFWELLFEIRKCRNKGENEKKGPVTKMTFADKMAIFIYILCMLLVFAFSLMAIFFF